MNDDTNNGVKPQVVAGIFAIIVAIISGVFLLITTWWPELPTPPKHLNGGHPEEEVSNSTGASTENGADNLSVPVDGNAVPISDYEGLYGILGNLSGTYYLTQDIDLEEIPLKEAWGVIGATQKAVFSGTFDGRGHTIKNMIIEDSHGGLFYAVSGTVRNLIVEDATIEYGAHESAVIASVLKDGGILENILIENARSVLHEEETSKGLLVCYSDNGTINCCGVTGELWSTHGNQGTLVGTAKDTNIINSFARVQLHPNIGVCGGLVGSGDHVSISYSYCANNYFLSPTVIHQTSFGPLIGNGAENHNSIEKCYYLSQNANDGGLKSHQMKVKASFIDWDFEADSAWMMDDRSDVTEEERLNDGYPTLRVFNTMRN